MNIAGAFAAELRHEAASTRKHLERVPFDKASWKPHAKSMTLVALASHLAEIPSWTNPTIELTELDIPADYKPWQAASSKELLEKFDEFLASALAILEKTEDAAMFVPWTFKSGGHAYFTMPRVVVMRSMIMNHLVHHRAQLGVYLRLLDVPVPSSYGPSADDQG